MPAARKFMFDLSFDPPHETAAANPVEAEPETPPEPEVPPPPTFTEEEFQAAVAQAFAEGKAAGAAEAAEATERLEALSLEAIAGRLTGLAKTEANALAHHERETIAFGLALARKLFPELARRHGLDEVEGVLRECLKLVAAQGKIVIRVAQDVAEMLPERIDALVAASGFEGRVSVVADARLAISDCRIEWAEGTAIRSADDLWREIDAIAARYLAPETERPHVAAPND